MITKDDRQEFEAHKREMALALGRDKEAFRQSLDTLVTLDRYDYAYLWSWMGLPIIQMPADIMATQEVIWANRPDVIIETGVARGGSLIFMASLLKVIGTGKVIGVDIDIRAHNREAIEAHPVAPLITLIEGSSTEVETVAQVRDAIPPGASVMVVLDSDHSREHVLAELRAYGPLVTPGQYLVVADTLLGQSEASQTPTKRSAIWYPGDEPYAALNAYLAETDRFEVDEALNGKLVLASSPGGYVRCKSV
ncbi:cephalosporin hydroxylase family protein [Sphingobium sufflavum]|uniref:cephalosporin hydroxylase family protein n=1 Tax=Sphingobium sufflavum TaxID=1129547 RepID=UPI001F2EE5FA|nr:CmcI family methyltransferase [Sphingobium sufflavum]MCE7795615.1 cephalosporin hydroxylase family protein [Sphingobium sufflavum]